MNELIYDTIIDVMALFITLILIVDSQKFKVKSFSQRIFNSLVIATFAILLVDIPAWWIAGKTFIGARLIHFIVNFFYYIFQVAWCFIWALYADLWVFNNKEKIKKNFIYYAIPSILGLAFIIINCFTGWIYKIDDSNKYVRGDLFNVFSSLMYLYILFSLVIAIYGAIKLRKNNNNRFQGITIICIMIMPIVGTVMQMLNYGVPLIWPFVAIAELMVYVVVQEKEIGRQKLKALNQDKMLAELENNLSQSQMQLMVSQIHPHFLFNSLSVIKYLMGTNSELAEEALDNFSTYLRGNVDSVNGESIVSFEQELEHTKAYLALEYLRFNDKLKVIYNIEETDFKLPILSVQPLVENAVKYGLLKKPNGGVLTIKSRRTKEGYEVTISDNGTGFDINNTTYSDTKTHIGIKNVCYRIENQCHGNVSISSTIGKGTTIVIFIPDSQNNKNELID